MRPAVPTLRLVPAVTVAWLPAFAFPVATPIGTYSPGST